MTANCLADRIDRQNFYAALTAAGMPEVPGEFSVVPCHQVISAAVVAEISAFIEAFDRVTTRAAWLAAALRSVPAIFQRRRKEVCFFSAWDFHLPPDGSWQLIEFNDNGSGFMFAAIINALYYKAAEMDRETAIAAPDSWSAFQQHIGDLVEQEATEFFGGLPDGLFVVLDEAHTLEQGRFRTELAMLRDLFQARGWQSTLASPTMLQWDGRNLLFNGRAVSFIVNRSTDFLWQSREFAALRSAYEAERVYVAPSPFTYATRSDKRLLEWLSLPHSDDALDVTPEERRILSAHVPETHVIRTENLDELARRKGEFVFKPAHGFAARGLLDSTAVGPTRLRRLLAHGEDYVAQRHVAKSNQDIDGQPLWTDLRVWAYRGKIFQLSGRASRCADRLDLSPPGGWLPTYRSLGL